MNALYRVVRRFFENVQLRLIATAALLLAVGLFVSGSTSAQGTPCGVGKPGACFEPVPDGFSGFIEDADGELAVVIISTSADSDFFLSIPNGRLRLHQNVNSVDLFVYCPANNPCVPGFAFVGEGRVSADVALPPAGGEVLCPSVIHMRGQVVDPQTGNSFDVDASLIAAGAADVQDDCRLVTLEVNAEPS